MRDKYIDQEASVAIREGKWKCSYCGAANLGRDATCQACGQTRGKDVKFYLDEDAAEVSDAALLNQAGSGADWTCSFCSTNNRGDAKACKQCGAERGASASLQEKFVPAGGSAPAAPAAPAPRKKGNPIGIAIGVVAAAAVVIFALSFLFKPSEKTGTLVQGTWQRSIPVQAFLWQQREAWEGQVPANAVVLSSHSEKYGTEKIQTGTQRVKTGSRDKGNGFFEDVYEEKPVYQERDVYKNKVSYKIQEWTVVRTLKKEGALGEEPAWPDVALAAGEREGARAESAQLRFQVDKKTYSKAVPVGELGQYRLEGVYRVWVTPLGAVTKVEKK